MGGGGHHVQNIHTLYTDDSGVIDCFSFEHSFTLTFDSGSISGLIFSRLALNQTITSMINAKNMIPAVVPVCVRARQRTQQRRRKQIEFVSVRFIFDHIL